jgi:hypothetical protein
MITDTMMAVVALPLLTGLRSIIDSFLGLSADAEGIAWQAGSADDGRFGSNWFRRPRGCRCGPSGLESNRNAIGALDQSIAARNTDGYRYVGACWRLPRSAVHGAIARARKLSSFSFPRNPVVFCGHDTLDNRFAQLLGNHPSTPAGFFWVRST